MYELLKSGQEIKWTKKCEIAFNCTLKLLTTTPCLTIFDANRQTILTVDSFSYGLGAMLRQEDNEGKIRSVVFASRILTETQRRYVQVEKERLTLTWACERFHDFIYGLRVKLETDYKLV